MQNVTLTSEEAAIVRAVLDRIVIEQRTGALGIRHGADRFVSMRLILRKAERTVLESACRKFGLPGPFPMKR